MLFTEFNLEDALEVRGEERYEDGLEDGKKEGIKEGEACHLIAMVCRKLNKGKTLEAIAEELDEDIAVIRPICEAAGTLGPDYDCSKIYRELLKEKR